METKRPTNPTTSNRLALYLVGLREGSRLGILGAPSRGAAPQVHKFNALPMAAAYQQNSSSGRSRKDGVPSPAVIFALGPEEGKGENDREKTTCHDCRIGCQKFGKIRKGQQRYRCCQCYKTYSNPRNEYIGNIYTAPEKAEAVISLLVEGCSARSIQRLTGIDQYTMMKILVLDSHVAWNTS